SYKNSLQQEETDLNGSLKYSFDDSSVEIKQHERSELAQARLEEMRMKRDPAIGIDPIDKSGPIVQPDTIIIERPGMPFLEASGFKISDREPL
ncbi:hypothetical protein, partial [Salmonella sp. s51228]|uniref:hypothetical protein n=1 Tax=Salmonella sp. s51228 TaxID=3159652 RepID=UPI00397F4505